MSSPTIELELKLRLGSENFTTLDASSGSRGKIPAFCGVQLGMGFGCAGRENLIFV
jgi:hypothetical protein